MKSVCVFAGARAGADSRYLEAATSLGSELARRGLHLVYGGSSKGLMGAMATAAINAGGRVTGISARQVRPVEGTAPLEGLHELVIAETMQQRREAMYQRGDTVIALPGGLGTLEELMEIWSWKHLGIHSKSIGLLNVAGFWDPLLDFVDALKEQGLARNDERLDPVVETSAALLLDRLHTSESKPPV